MAEKTKKGFGIQAKVTLAFLLLSFIPMAILGVMSIVQVRRVGNEAINDSRTALDAKSKESIELRALETAGRIAYFLREREADLYSAAMLRRTPQAFLEFFNARQGIVWYKTQNNPQGEKFNTPIYKEIVFVDKSGMEMIKVKDKRSCPSNELRNVKYSENTLYKADDYFSKTIKLPPGKIYVSNVIGRYVIKDDVLRDVENVTDVIEGEGENKRFKGIIRFSMPIYASSGKSPIGVIALALDHTHIMELVEHIVPTEERFSAAPDPTTGNWAYMVDNEGWTIAHPNDWNIRGVDRDGNDVEAANKPYHLKDRFLSQPVNLNEIGDMEEFKEYSTLTAILDRVKEGTGSLDYYWEGHYKFVAYSPIKYYGGDYKAPAGFGWIAIGADLEKFHEAATETGKKISRTTVITLWITVIVIVLAIGLVVGVATYLAKNITNPIIRLTGLANEISMGNLELRVDVTSTDEIGALSESVGRLAISLQAAMKRLSKRKR